MVEWSTAQQADFVNDRVAQSSWFENTKRGV
jgi:hypothetical protein